MESAEDCLNILGLSQGASWDEINEAYRDLVRVWHPDRFQADERLRKKAEEHTRLLNQAIRELREQYKLGASSEKRPATNAKTKRKQSFYSNVTGNAAPGRERRAGFKLAPLLVYQRPVSAVARIMGACLMAYLGYFCVRHANGEPYQTAFASVMTLFSLNSITKNACLLFVRRPMIRVDATGISSIETGTLAWTDLAKVWTFVQASSPALAIECSELYLKHQPFFKRFVLRFRHAFRSAHIVVTCGGLDAHPNDVVRAINAQHLTGDVQTPQISTAFEGTGLRWSRLIAAVSALTLVLKCLLGREMTPFDFALYFTIFAASQFYAIASRLLRVPQQT